MNLIDAVADWKVDASNEPNLDYYVSFKMQERVEDGRRSLIVGRRGTGKTALARYIASKNKSTILNFDLFHFAKLDHFKEDTFNSRHEFISIWTYITTMACLEVIYKSCQIDYDSRKELSKVFEAQNGLDATKKIGAWTQFSANLSFMGVEINGKAHRGSELELPKVREINERSRKFIRSLKLDDKIFVFFDGLDEDLDAKSTHRSLYLNLITSLIKSTIGIKTDVNGENILPVICLRDDIYYQIEENDKSKWADHIYRPEWNDSKIEKIIRWRLAATDHPRYQKSALQELLSELFTPGRIKTGSGKIANFEFMKPYTQNRPRDYIAFLKHAASKSIDNDRIQISPEILKESIPIYSNYFMEEISSELRMVLKNANSIIKTLSKIGQPIFKMDRFIDLYNYGDRGEDWADIDRVILFLYRYGVLGNCYANGRRVFSYDNFGHNILETESVAFHRALYSALGIN